MGTACASPPVRLADRLLGFGPGESADGIALPGERDLRATRRAGLRLVVAPARPGMLLQVWYDGLDPRQVVVAPRAVPRMG